jgi:hypothetical protein
VGAGDYPRKPAFGPWIGVLPHVLDFAVFVESDAAEFATVAGALHAARFGLRHVGVVVVDPDGSVPQPVRDAPGLACVLGPHRACQPVDGVIGQPHRFVFVGECLEGQHRIERFLLCGRHSRVAAIQNRGGIEEAVTQMRVLRSAAAALQHGALCQTSGHVGLDLVPVGGRDQRAGLGVRVEWSAERDPLGACDNLVDEPIVQ